jgi:dynein light chain Tctex-type 1
MSYVIRSIYFNIYVLDTLPWTGYIYDVFWFILRQAIEATLKDTVYNRKKVNDWTNSLVALVLSGLQNLNKPFKYVVTCLITQKTGAGVTTSAACYWDPVLDGNIIKSL